MGSESLLWELRGRAGNALTCVLYPIEAGRHLLTVTLGDRVLVSDRYPTEEDALRQAAFLMTDFLDNGWTEVYRHATDKP